MLMPHPDLLYIQSCAHIQRLREEADHQRQLDQARHALPRAAAGALAPRLNRALAALRAAWPTARVRHHHRLLTEH
jgi:hypothetical protein